MSNRVSSRGPVSRGFHSAPHSFGPPSSTLSNTIKGHSMADSGLEKLPFSTSTSIPKWRLISPGLCLEGICDNRQCQAHGQKVYCSAGFTTLNLVKDTWRVKCPACRHMFDATSVAFNNCEWKVSGTKQAHPGAMSEAVDQQEWQVAGKCYERFKDDPTDKTIWSSLIISTRKHKPKHEPKHEPAHIAQPAALPLTSPPAPPSSSHMTECTICCGPPMSRFGLDAINTPCGHCFHRQCLQPWVVRANGGCPTCRRDISCLAQELAPG